MLDIDEWFGDLCTNYSGIVSTCFARLPMSVYLGNLLVVICVYDRAGEGDLPVSAANE